MSLSSNCEVYFESITPPSFIIFWMFFDSMRMFFSFSWASVLPNFEYLSKASSMLPCPPDAIVRCRFETKMSNLKRARENGTMARRSHFPQRPFAHSEETSLQQRSLTNVVDYLKSVRRVALPRRLSTEKGSNREGGRNVCRPKLPSSTYTINLFINVSHSSLLRRRQKRRFAVTCAGKV